PDGQFARWHPLPDHAIASLAIGHTLPKTVDPERAEPTPWHLCCRIPLGVLAAQVGPLGPLPGQRWRANFYKCADRCSHPHWASWCPIGPALNFHQPHAFGWVAFA